MNLLHNRMVLIVSIFLLVSCTSTNQLFKNNTVNNDAHFSKTYLFSNKSVLGISKVDSTLTLLHLLGVYSKAVGSDVQVKFNSTNEITIQYLDSAIVTTKTLKGKYIKGKYFKNFIEKKVIQIPPIISFLYGQRIINRIKLGFNEAGLLVVENKYVKEGNVLFFGAGVNYKTVSYFKTIN
jgi:hypothetical protein